MPTRSSSFVRLLKSTALALALLGAVAPAALAGGVSYFVDSFEDLPDADPLDRACAAVDGRCTLRAAVMQANETFGAVIYLEEGAYKLTIPGADENRGATGDLDLRSTLQIIGSGAPGTTIVDASGIDRVFHVSSPDGGESLPSASLLNLVIVGGKPGDASPGGGGVFVEDGDVSVEECTLTDNAAPTGSALLVAADAAAYLFQTSVSANPVVGASSTSALRHEAGSYLYIERSRIFRSEGVPILSEGGTLYVDQSSVTENASGGVLLVGGSDDSYEATIDRSTISSNGGTGLENAWGEFGRMAIYDSTITQNAIGVATPNGASTTASNSIVAKNAQGDCREPLTSLDYNIDSDGSCIGNADTSNDQAGVDPQLAPLAYNGGYPTFSHVPLPGSPAIDRGQAGSEGTSDQRGYPRNVSIADVGAVETLLFRVDAFGDGRDGLPGDGICDTRNFEVEVCTLRAALMEANAIADPLREIETQALRTVLLPPGSYALSIQGIGENIGANGDLDIAKAIRIAGLGPVGGVDVSARNLDRVFDAHESARRFELQNVAVHDGRIPDEPSSDAFGGGIRARAVSNTLIDVEIFDNLAFSGGGLAIGNPDAPDVTSLFNVDVFANTAVDSCGGVRFESGPGGALPPAANSGVIEFSSIVSNAAPLAGGLCVIGGRVELSNSTVAQNTATVLGGGMIAEDTLLSVYFSTFALNDAPAGAAIANSRSSAAWGTTLSASVLGSNTGSLACDGEGGVIGSGGANVDEDGSCVGPLENPGDVVGVDAQLIPDLSGHGGGELVIPLLGSSPAVARVGASLCSQYPQDQRTQVRPFTGPCDSGAVQFFCVAGPTCQTGQSGVCADGVVECPFGIDGPPSCQPTTAPSAELCDGIDNDCNGAADDGIAPLVRGSDVGTCQQEIQSCVDGTFVVTQELIGPAAETCDGLDNDCNETADDGIAPLVSGSNVGTCQQEIQSCVGGSFQVTQTGVGPVAEICDGLDNDCDATADDGIAPLVSGTDVGTCQQEIQSCVGGSFQVTQAGIGPAAETCDGLDNDCNATADDGIAPLVSGTDVGTCQQEIQSCVGGSFQVTQAGIGPAAELCDGLDNDCNATADDGIAPLVSGSDVGTCQQEIQSCVGGSFQVTQAGIRPAAELCDGLDNDCDATADDGIAPLVSGSDVGTCRQEIQSCVGGSFQVTQVGIGPAAEICDGLDNDCDETADDGIAPIATGSDVGSCQQEIQSCVGGSFQVTQAGIGPAAELCDGLDNDCNATADDGIAPLVSGSNVGTCRQEIQSCVGGSFQVTQTGVGPSAEICDGLDNDCDETADDGIAPLVSGSDVGTCRQEIQSCVGGSFQVTQAGIGPAAELCDGLDNDCNATADDGIAPLVSGSDVGTCRQEIQSCVGGSFQVTQTGVGPVAEICDGLDNDCDETPDDGIEPLVSGTNVGTCRTEIQSCVGGSFIVTQTGIGAVAELCDGEDNDCDGTPDDGIVPLVSGSDVGTCQQEIQSCVGGSFQVTQAGVGPVAEVCDGLDNDCNATADDGVAPLVSGSDVGTCQQEIQSCVDGSFQVTQVGVGPAAEQCDGLDNDCNEIADDGIAPLVNGVDAGVCEFEIRECIEGAFEVTQVQVGPSAETCDGEDNDCNGTPDDGIEPVVTGTDVGTCQTGIQTCIDGALQVTQALIGPTAEECDGLDNDCDGAADDEVPQRFSGTGLGTCQQQIESCIGGAYEVTQQGIEPQPESCDGFDNDCDGEADDGIAPIVTGTDVGPCQPRIEECVGGAITITQQEIDPTVEVCDGEDNDCDGTPDEDVRLVSGTDEGICRSEIQTCIGGEFQITQTGIEPEPRDLCANGEDDDCDGSIDEIACGIAQFDAWAEDIELLPSSSREEILVVAAARTAGMHVVSFALNDPVTIGVFDPPSCTNGPNNVPLFAEDVHLDTSLQRAYLSLGECGFQVIDLSDPSEPTLLGSFDTPGWVEDIWKEPGSEILYVADHNGGVQTYDASDPQQILLLGVVGFTDAAFGAAIDLMVEDDRLYVATTRGMRIIDISDPTDLLEIGGFETDGLTGVGQDVQVVRDEAGVLAYLSAWVDGVYVLDVDDPEDVFAIAQIPSFAQGETASQEVTIAGRMAFVADGITALRIFDVGDPENPLEVEPFDTQGLGYAWDVEVDGAVVYVAFGEFAPGGTSGGVQAFHSTEMGVSPTFIINSNIPEPGTRALAAAALVALLGLRAIGRRSARIRAGRRT